MPRSRANETEKAGNLANSKVIESRREKSDAERESFDVASFLGFRAEGPAIYLAQPCRARWAGLGKRTGLRP